MEGDQFEELIEELTAIKNLLILIASKNGAQSAEIAKVINTSDSWIRQILTGKGGKRKNGK